jgi:hypothetical protein
MMQVPNEFSPTQLKKVGILIVNGNPLRLRCDKCAEEWTLDKKGLRLPKGYWRCPRGCNEQVDAVGSTGAQ